MPGSRELWLRNGFTCTTEFFLAICRGSEKPLSVALRFWIKPLASLPCLSPSAKLSTGAGSLTWRAAAKQGSYPRLFCPPVCCTVCSKPGHVDHRGRSMAATCAGSGPARCHQEGLQRLTLTPCPPAEGPEPPVVSVVMNREVGPHACLSTLRLL